MEALVFSLILLWVTGACCDRFYPVMSPQHVRRYSVDDSELKNPRFRALIVDEEEQYAYVGAQSAVFKLRLSAGDDMLSARSDIRSVKDDKPSFKDKSTDREWWSTVRYTDSEFQNYSPVKDILEEFEPTPNIDTYKSLNLRNRLDDYLRDIPFGSVTDLEGNSVLETAQQYASIYQCANLTFREHCIRQAEALSLYYGRDLQMNVTDISLLCDTHIRGMTLMGNGKLFTIQTGLFGTMPVSATGTNRYEDWLRYQGEIQPFLSCLFDPLSSTCRPNSPTRPPFTADSYDGVVTDPPEKSDANRLPDSHTYLMPSPENYLGKRRHCDNNPAPNRLILRTTDLKSLNDQVLIGQVEKESCGEGALAQIFLGGYHPDQKTFSHYSSAGNGPMGDKQAVYILTEIGQEKQLDLMREFLNLPEIYPLSSSASLAMVRILVDRVSGDIDDKSIVISNPFKHTWVTSPLNRFGRLNKVGSQDQVAYTPKPVALHEDSDYIYFFFREADWENTPVPSYNIRRYHHSLNFYTHALYFPWEKSFIDRVYIKHEESPKVTYEELYAPKYMGWQHVNDNLKVTGRVARVSKHDAGLPMGLQDASLFDLDHKLSLTTFQTFVKSRLTCRVPVAGKYCLQCC